MSQMAPISYRSARASRMGRWMICATSPSPMTPTLTRCMLNTSTRTPGRARFDQAPAPGASGKDKDIMPKNPISCHLITWGTDLETGMREASDLGFHACETFTHLALEHENDI